MTVVTRFPPSPTGFMHVGTARTALYNWLFAKHHGGVMKFRIEDTDRARYNEAAIAALVNGIGWLGLDWEGEVISQYARRDHHADIARQLLAMGKAYHCYCTPEELETMRHAAMAAGKPTLYDRRWRDSTATPPPGIDPVIRIKAPLSGTVTVHDKVQGDVVINAEQLDDFILLRSDGTPTYMLAVVVDDFDMGVTHVIRGDDHLNNTFRQNIILDAMGWRIPVYAHLPLILDAKGAKLSKRTGAASLEEFRDQGYLPEAMFNYLLRLGWSHGDDDIITRDQAIAWFDLDHVVKSPARWDMDKLTHLNAHYIKQADNARLADLAGADFSAAGKTRLMAGMDDLKHRATTIHQIRIEGIFYDQAPMDYDEKAHAALAEAGPVLSNLIDLFQSFDPFDAETIEPALKDLASNKADGKLGTIMMPLRAALTGTSISPPLPRACVLLGRPEVLARLHKARTHFSC